MTQPHKKYTPMRTIYNTTFIIEEPIEQEWIAFIQTHCLPSLRDNRICDDVIFTKVSINQPEGKTYSLQVVFNNEQQKDRYLTEHLPAIESKLISQYAGRYVCFSSVLTEI